MARRGWPVCVFAYIAWEGHQTDKPGDMAGCDLNRSCGCGPADFLQNGS